MTLTQGLLNRITGLLNHDATNYTVFLRLYQVSTKSNVNNLETCIRSAVSADAELDVEAEISPATLVAEMEGLLRYGGDPGAGPNEAVLGSEALSEFLAELKIGVLELASRAKNIKRFEFKAGHPAYPVFWDFAFAFIENESVTILVGSSSD